MTTTRANERARAKSDRSYLRAREGLVYLFISVINDNKWSLFISTIWGSFEMIFHACFNRNDLEKIEKIFLYLKFLENVIFFIESLWFCKILSKINLKSTEDSSKIMCSPRPRTVGIVRTILPRAKGGGRANPARASMTGLRAWIML